MPTVQEVARKALAAVATTGNLELAGQWVSDRFAELASRIHLRALRVSSSLVVPAVLSAGTVTVTQGSDLVVGDATAAAVWATDLAGRFFQGRIGWYEIGGVSGNTLHLRTPYAEEFSASAVGYRIVVRYPAFAEDLRHLGSVRSNTWRRDLVKRTAEWVNQSERVFLSAGPSVFADLGDQDGRRLIEVYPYSTRDEQLSYTYWKRPPRLELTDLLPTSIDAQLLVDGVLIDVMRYQAALAAQASNTTLAGFWANWASRQESVWASRIDAALRTDTAVDDGSVRLGAGGHGGGDIVTARDEVWSRGGWFR